MTRAEVAIIIRQFETIWPHLFEVTDEMLTLWEEEIYDLDFAACAATAKHIIATKDRPPPPSVFLAEYANLTRPMQELEPAVVCQHCDHGWVSGAPVEQRYKQGDGSVKVEQVRTTRPCEHCNPVGFEAWQKRAAAKRRTTVAPEDRTYPSNPREGLAHAREALTEVLDKIEAAADIAPPPEDVPAPAAAFDARDRMLSYDEAYPEEDHG